MRLLSNGGARRAHRPATMPVRILAIAIALCATAAATMTPQQSAAKRFLNNFAANRLDAASSDFNEQMRGTVTLAVLTNFKQQFDRDLGRFLAVRSVHEGMSGDFPVVE